MFCAARTRTPVSAVSIHRPPRQRRGCLPFDWRGLRNRRIGAGFVRYGSGTARRRALLDPLNYPLVRDKTRMVGDYVAFVAAETLKQAKDAVEAIKAAAASC